MSTRESSVTCLQLSVGLDSALRNS